MDEGAAPEKSKQGEMNPEFVEKTVQSPFWWAFARMLFL